MERLRNGIQRAVYRLRTDRRRRVLFISGLIGLSIITAVLVDGNSMILSWREMALLIGGILMGVEYCLGYQIEQEKREEEKNPKVIVMTKYDD